MEAAAPQEARSPTPSCLALTWDECALHACLEPPLPSLHSFLPPRGEDDLQDPKVTLQISVPEAFPREGKTGNSWPRPSGEQDTGRSRQGGGGGSTARTAPRAGSKQKNPWMPISLFAASGCLEFRPQLEYVSLIILVFVFPELMPFSPLFLGKKNAFKCQPAPVVAKGKTWVY